MNFFARFILATLLGFAIAGLIHIGLIFSIPYLTHNSPYHLIKKLSPDGKPVTIPRNHPFYPPQSDPFITLAACPLNFNKGLMHITTKKSAVFQAVSIHNRFGKVIFSATDRAATSGLLDIVVGTPQDIEAYHKKYNDAEDALFRGLSVIMDEPEGYAVLRVLAHAPSYTHIAQETAQMFSCSPH